MAKLLVAVIGCLMVSTFAENIDKNAEVRSFQNEAADAEGAYQFAYELTNGIQYQEAGNSAGVRGALNYVSPEGERIALTYTADEQGYHPSGDHLPTPPPVPAHVLRALEYIRLHPPPVADKDQQ